jgi:uncharacterized protein
MVRVVIDTNVLISAVITDGKPRQLVLKLLEEHTVITSNQVLAEAADVIARDKFAIKSPQVNRFLTILTKNSKMVLDNPRFKVVSEDSDDDVILNVAYTGKANYIVTGDMHLLALKKFRQTKIVTVAQMLEILAKC